MFLPIFIILLKLTTFYLIIRGLLRKLTPNYRIAGKTHFLQNFTLIYLILPKFIKNYHILRKIFANSHRFICICNFDLLISLNEIQNFINV